MIFSAKQSHFVWTFPTFPGGGKQRVKKKNSFAADVVYQDGQYRIYLPADIFYMDAFGTGSDTDGVCSAAQPELWLWICIPITLPGSTQRV